MNSLTPEQKGMILFCKELGVKRICLMNNEGYRSIDVEFHPSIPIEEVVQETPQVERYLDPDYPAKMVKQEYQEKVLDPVVQLHTTFINCLPLEYTPQQFWERIWQFIKAIDPKYVVDVEKEMFALKFFTPELYYQMKQQQMINFAQGEMQRLGEAYQSFVTSQVRPNLNLDLCEQ